MHSASEFGKRSNAVKESQPTDSTDDSLACTVVVPTHETLQVAVTACPEGQ